MEFILGEVIETPMTEEKRAYFDSWENAGEMVPWEQKEQDNNE